MKKQILLFSLALLSVTASAYDAKIDGIYYNFSETEATVTYFKRNSSYSNYNKTAYFGNIVIPEYVSYNGKMYSVTSIGEYAFSACTDLTSVIIPNSVTTIGSGAFSACSGLTSIIIPNSVTSIGDYAFSGSSGLTNVTIGNSVTKIGFKAFSECRELTAVNITDLFAWCKIEFNGTQGSNPLYYAQHLYLNDEEVKDLVIPDGITYIEHSAFQNCKDITSVTFPHGVTSIGLSAFQECSSLTSVSFPITLKSIGYLAFGSCTGLTSVTIPSSATNIKYAFASCSNLTTIIYTGKKAPTGWVATTKTYVPDINEYTSPSEPGEIMKEDAQIIEMITFNEYEFEYTGQSPTTTWINNVEGYTATLDLSTLSGEVGEHEVWIPVTFTKEDESFTANVVYRYTIKYPKITAKVENASREYGEDNPQFKVTYSGFSNGDDESVITTQPIASTTANRRSNVGEYPITLSGGTATNYEIVYESGILTVTKAPLSAKVNDATKLYGSQNPAFTIEYNGLKNEETAPRWATSPTFQTEATRTSGVGQYIVNAVNGVPMNYELSGIASGTLNVTPAPLSIKAADAERQYYNENPDFSYICSGFVNGDDEGILTATPMLSTTANLSSNVGTYEIEVSEASASNYSISYENGTLTITPRTLLASVGNYERPYNEENPEFEVKYFGFVENENESALNENVIATTTATKTSDVGTYKIEMTGGNADNYIFSYSSGILTINKAEQTVLWEQDFSNLEIGDQVELVAVASSGLPVAFAIDDSSFAEIYTAGTKTYLDCKAKGETQIVATQDGNKNYHSSSRVRKTVHIGDGSSSVNSVTGAVVKIRMISTGIRVDNVSVGEMIRVYTSDGVLLKNVKAESQSIEIPLTKNHLYFIKVGTKTFKFSY